MMLAYLDNAKIKNFFVTNKSLVNIFSKYNRYNQLYNIFDIHILKFNILNIDKTCYLYQNYIIQLTLKTLNLSNFISKKTYFLEKNLHSTKLSKLILF